VAAEHAAATALARAREGASGTLDALTARMTLLRGRAVGASAEFVDAAAASVTYARRIVEGSSSAGAIGPAVEEAEAALETALARVDTEAAAAAAAAADGAAAAARLAPAEADLRDVSARAAEAGVVRGGAVAAALQVASRGVSAAAHACEGTGRVGVMMPREAEELSRAVDAAVVAVADARQVVDAAIAAASEERDARAALAVRTRARVVDA
jgi:hypothetical protein